MGSIPISSTNKLVLSVTCPTNLSPRRMRPDGKVVRPKIIKVRRADKQITRNRCDANGRHSEQHRQHWDRGRRVRSAAILSSQVILSRASSARTLSRQARSSLIRSSTAWASALSSVRYDSSSAITSALLLKRRRNPPCPPSQQQLPFSLSQEQLPRVLSQQRPPRSAQQPHWQPHSLSDWHSQTWP